MKDTTRSNFDTRKITFSAILIVIGLILPNIFHMIGGPTAGNIFLPMHIPILIAGLLLGPISGLIVAIITPLLGFFFLGMPPIPILPFMVFELIGYGLASGFGYFKKYNLYLSLILAQIVGRIFNFIALVIAANLLHVHANPVAAITVSSVDGIPGIIVQLIIIPPLIIVIRKAVNIK